MQLLGQHSCDTHTYINKCIGHLIGPSTLERPRGKEDKYDIKRQNNEKNGEVDKRIEKYDEEKN